MLSSKAAFVFSNHVGQHVSWGKSVRLFGNPSSLPQKKIRFGGFCTVRSPTCEHLRTHGCIVVSRCSLCGLTDETSIHLFLQCPFVVRIWNWLSFIVVSQVLS